MLRLAFHYLFNAHGDVVKLTDSTGAVTKSYDYDAFGNEVNLDANDVNPFRYCGEYFDKETGNYYLRARYYDPTIGRFTQEDFAKDGLNYYTYCNNNPVIYVDPSGYYYIYNSGGQTYAVIQSGDTLSGISESEVNDPTAYLKLGMSDPGSIYPGEVINISNIYNANYPAPYLFGGNYNPYDFEDMTIDDILDDLPFGWYIGGGGGHNGHYNIYDQNGKLRMRIDPPDKSTSYDHIHLFDEKGNSLDKDLNVDDSDSPSVHIEIRPNTGNGNSSYDGDNESDTNGEELDDPDDPDVPEVVPDEPDDPEIPDLPELPDIDIFDIF